MEHESSNAEVESSNSAGTMRTRHDQGRLQTADEVELCWQTWSPTTPRAVLILTHGLAEHSNRYSETAEYFAAQGIAVVTGDLRGHGNSADGPKPGRVHIDRFSDYYHDVDALFDLARNRYGALPVFLLGHSMGGLIALSYTLNQPGEVVGTIISSPALGTHPDFQPPKMLKLLVSVLSRLAPRMKFKSELDNNAISRDPDVVRAYNEDPLVSGKVSARWFAEMMKAMEQAHTHAAKLNSPMLLMQSGADRLVDPQATVRWANAAASNQLELKVWDGLFHEMFNEPEKAQVRQHVIQWLDQQLEQHSDHN